MKKIILGMALAVSLMFSLAAQAEEKETPVAIPDTPAAIHQSVNKEMDEMTKMIAAGSVKDLHHHAFAVRDLVAALPEKSASLAQDKLAAVKSSGKFVATIADRLDAAGDSNDKTAAAENLKKLSGVLDSIWTNYPDAAK
jgi:hypothetical protein